MSLMPDSSRLILTVFRMPSRLLPPGAPPQLRRGCLAMSLAAVPLWGLTIAGIWLPWDWRAQGVIRAAAVTAAVIAGMCWGLCWLHDGQMRAVIRQNGDLYRRIPQEARPPRMVSAR